MIHLSTCRVVRLSDFRCSHAFATGSSSSSFGTIVKLYCLPTVFKGHFSHTRTLLSTAPRSLPMNSSYCSLSLSLALSRSLSLSLSFFFFFSFSISLSLSISFPVSNLRLFPSQSFDCRDSNSLVSLIFSLSISLLVSSLSFSLCLFYFFLNTVHYIAHPKSLF